MCVVREPNSGTVVDAAQSRLGSIEMKWTASVSPGCAPSMWKGPSTGLAPLIVTAPRTHRSGAARGGREGCPASRENPQ
jgi:hypothetical protein